MKSINLKLENYNDMVEQFHDETDRGAAVLAGSYVDAVLVSYITYSMTDKNNSEELFSSSGPLSDFSHRIKIARAFGLISVNDAKTLHLIRKIRNHFAHHPMSATFQESPVRDWVANLYELLPLRDEQKEERMIPRHVYLIGGGRIAALFHMKMENLINGENGKK